MIASPRIYDKPMLLAIHCRRRRCGRAKPETSRFGMTNLEDANRGCRTGARKTRAWPTTDPTKTCSDHILRSTDLPSPHGFIIIWYKLEPDHVLSQDTLVTAAILLRTGAVLRYPAPSNISSLIQCCHVVLSYHDKCRIHPAVRITCF